MAGGHAQRLFASRRPLCVAKSSSRRKATISVISQGMMAPKVTEDGPGTPGQSGMELEGSGPSAGADPILHRAYVCSRCGAPIPTEIAEHTPCHALLMAGSLGAERGRTREGPRASMGVTQCPSLPCIAGGRRQSPGRFGASVVSSRPSCRPLNGDVSASCISRVPSICGNDLVATGGWRARHLGDWPAGFKDPAASPSYPGANSKCLCDPSLAVTNWPGTRETAVPKAIAGRRLRFLWGRGPFVISHLFHHRQPLRHAG